MLFFCRVSGHVRACEGLIVTTRIPCRRGILVAGADVPWPRDCACCRLFSNFWPLHGVDEDGYRDGAIKRFLHHEY